MLELGVPERCDSGVTPLLSTSILRFLAVGFLAGFVFSLFFSDFCVVRDLGPLLTGALGLGAVAGDLAIVGVEASCLTALVAFSFDSFESSLASWSSIDCLTPSLRNNAFSDFDFSFFSAATGGGCAIFSMSLTLVSST